MDAQDDINRDELEENQPEELTPSGGFDVPQADAHEAVISSW
jgi:hypothetical protein